MFSGWPDQVCYIFLIAKLTCAPMLLSRLRYKALAWGSRWPSAVAASAGKHRQHPEYAPEAAGVIHSQWNRSRGRSAGPCGPFGAIPALISSAVTRQSPFLSNFRKNGLGFSTNSLRVILPSWFSSK